MSSHVFSEIFLHFNWHTDHDEPLLNPQLESFVHKYLKQKCKAIKGVFCHEVGGTETHIHLAVRVEPYVTPSELVQLLKGSSSHDTNEHFKRKLLNWQRGYGVVSFGKKNLSWVKKYIQNQKHHHAKGTVEDRMEATEQDEGSPAEVG